MSHAEFGSPVAQLLDDALLLYQDGRRHSAILLLLCAIDALAREHSLGNARNADRFEAFLKLKMRRPGRPQIHQIYVPKLDTLFTFEYIIYKFLRCPLIHEGSRLVADDQEECPVVLDWESIPNGVEVDGDRGRVILGGDLVFGILVDAIRHELEETP